VFWIKLKTLGRSLKKLCPSQKTINPLNEIVAFSETIWCLKLVMGLSFCLRPLHSCRAPEQCTCWTPSHRPWASNPNSELRVKPHRDTAIVSFSQTFTVTHCCTYLQHCQSTATNERSFSTLQQLLAYLRSTMG